MDEEELGSDSSDEDYVPTENQGLSEEEDSGDEEDFPAEEEETEEGTKKGGRSKKGAAKNKPSVVSIRKRRGGIKLPDDESPPTHNSPPCADDTASGEDAASLAEQAAAERKAKQEAEAKAKADLLWADFMKDMSSKPKPRATPAGGAATGPTATGDGKPAAAIDKKTEPGGSANSGGSMSKPGGKVVIVKEFKFAGETVTMSSTVDADSKEAKQELGKGGKVATASSSSTQSSTEPTVGVKRPGGLGSVLSKLDKRPKMSTLVKSKLDWEGFKSAEGIDDDLKIHNRGKDGFLERQAFLERTDHRQFEIERNLRLGAKRK